MEAFNVKINNQDYAINPLEEKDQILYEVYGEGLLCVIGLNEYAEWEANNDYSEKLVRQYGEAIEKHEA